ncbi:MAG: YkgJ family cysteine cluster protein [Gemmatimonadota bacterium]|jgi:Fe-S-cluster containining protein
MKLEETILSEHPRLGPDDTFQFSCHPGVSCYTCCCSDVNIFLTPWDVLRLKNRLGISSGEFLDQYALVPIQKDMKTPVVLLRMTDDETRTCPFLAEGGCSVYSDRPWPCRMYPLGLAARKDTPDGWQGERFYFLLKEESCKGFDEPKEQTVSEWMTEQEIEAWDRWGEAYKELALHEFFEHGGVLAPERMEMFFTACYDLDRFRDFVFESTLLDRFEIDEDFVEEMRTDDEALLRFAFLWLRFSVFGEPTMKVKPTVLEAFRGSLEKKRTLARTPQARATAGSAAEAGRS